LACSAIQPGVDIVQLPAHASEKRNRSLSPSRLTTKERGPVKNAYFIFNQFTFLPAENRNSCSVSTFLSAPGLERIAAIPFGVAQASTIASISVGPSLLHRL